MESVKDESLGLETKGTETLSLVQNFGTCLVLVSSQMKIFGTVSSRSRLVCFNFIQSRLGLVLICMCSFKNNKPKLPHSAQTWILNPS